MHKQFFANMESPAFPLFALAVFFTAFLLMLARTFLYKRKGDFEPFASMPLNDETKEVKS